MKIGRLYSFEAAHVVRDCASKRCKYSIHGHSYTAEIALSAKGLDKAGMIYDFGLMKREIGSIIDCFDHSTILFTGDDDGYKNMISQEIRIKDIVPVQMPLDMANTEKFDSLMEVEPSNEDDTIIGELLKKYLEYGMYYSLIDSLAAEHCSRMQAMDNASKNAKAKVKELDLAYNKARQGNITTELIEIISGVESMK